MKAPSTRGASTADVILVGLFLLGIYLGWAIQITQRIPMPATLSGIAGMVLLWRRRDQITPAHLATLSAVILLYVGSILSASNYMFLSKRFTGLVQLTYSLILSYALFLTILEMSRRQLARLFLGFSLVIVIGSLLETYGGLRAISDAARLKLYSSGIYDSDFRDQLLYGKIRPKLFTSEPSAVTFSYTLFTFAWFLASSWRWKLLVYLALLGVGLFAMPGPTLLLMLLLLLPYELFLRRDASQQRNTSRILKIAVFSTVMILAFVYAGTAIYSERFRQITNGEDASFFYRETGPALTAIDVIKHHPWAGAGLTGEPSIVQEVFTVYTQSPAFSAGWQIDKIADVLTNYFWLHWIYLGFVWGTVTLIALTVWLRVLDVPSALFCWVVWVILGQASGAYVGPKTWAVLMLSAALSVLYRRSLQPKRSFGGLDVTAVRLARGAERVAYPRPLRI